MGFLNPWSCPVSLAAPFTLLGPMKRNLESIFENTRDIWNLLKVEEEIFKKKNVGN